MSQILEKDTSGISATPLSAKDCSFKLSDGECSNLNSHNSPKVNGLDPRVNIWGPDILKNRIPSVSNIPTCCSLPANLYRYMVSGPSSRVLEPV